ncbi:hypothetical protein ACF1B0_30450 [Streptomyces anandii]|uniref:hypothetical protein n=1 Tax=Streptomyces anandii TaxID=285454 RepID=UPI0036F8292E
MPALAGGVDHGGHGGGAADGLGAGITAERVGGDIDGAQDVGRDGAVLSGGEAVQRGGDPDVLLVAQAQDGCRRRGCRWLDEDFRGGSGGEQVAQGAGEGAQGVRAGQQRFAAVEDDRN